MPAELNILLIVAAVLAGSVGGLLLGTIDRQMRRKTSERLRQAERNATLAEVAAYHDEQEAAAKADARRYQSDRISDGSVAEALSDAMLHAESAAYVRGLQS